MWAKLRSGRRIKFLFHGVGANPWVRERRNGLALSFYNRLMEDDRFPREQILTEVQWCLNTLISGGGFSAYQLVFGSNPADLFGWVYEDEDLPLAQDTSLSGQNVQQWRLHMMQEWIMHDA